MATHDRLYSQFLELHNAQFSEYQQEMARRQAMVEPDGKIRKARAKRRREFMAASGVDLKKFEAAVEAEARAQEADLKTFLADAKPKDTGRDLAGAAAARNAAIRSAALAQAGQLVVPVFASAIIASDLSLLTDVVGAKPIDPPITGGWVMPDDATRIPVADIQHYPNAMCYDNRWDAPPQYTASFTFTPAATATYEMTPIMAYHGFYVLRCEDTWWSCRDAWVKLSAQVNVHQYTDVGWKDFPVLLFVEKDNAQEVTSYDRTFFLDYTTGLRAGDPVIVTVRGVVEANAHGAGAYAELNFKDGTANYIQPLFMSVQQV